MPIINGSAAAVAEARGVASQAGYGAGGEGGSGGDGGHPPSEMFGVPRARAPFGFLLMTLYNILTQTLTKFITQRNGEFSFAEGHFLTSCRIQEETRHYRIRNTVTGQTYNAVWPLQPQMSIVVRWFMNNFPMCKYNSYIDITFFLFLPKVSHLSVKN